MKENYEIDNLDRQILAQLLKDARTPFLEIARKLIVSGGTIHQRIEKLKKMGVIEGSKFELNLQKLGYDVTVFLGIHLTNAKDLNMVIEKLKAMPEVVEAHYTTGNYALLVKLHTKSIRDFHAFLAERLQSIEAIQSTESFISLDQPIKREITP
ncbi:MAG: transcriptional regulator AsnC [Halobacteriovoraceae bacterium]|nr:transcriptional regulator AsnC [Peredibacter sp.]MBJ00476.1 transcriptional regulator AsnC [Halobacteriovoraceae bacterium]|tara:strand:- start:473 stop:934 length:462 start_codon:yes stop_codon:yes gene_type:complete